MKTTNTPQNICPCCGTSHNRATSANAKNVSPTAGSISICVDCYGIAQFNADLTLSAVPADKLPALYAENPGLEKNIEQAITLLKQAKQKLRNTPSHRLH